MNMVTGPLLGWKMVGREVGLSLGRGAVSSLMGKPLYCSLCLVLLVLGAGYNEMVLFGQVAFSQPVLGPLVRLASGVPGWGGEEKVPQLPERLHPGKGSLGMGGQVMKMPWADSPLAAGAGPLQPELVGLLEVPVLG